ncbi:hypothetical protein OIO90_005174 [Microbotryomycetes sp. JL221]|nr:hypothetical protein OIO90_005174 [Microbotryomycetes sp. JL221]
MPDEDHVGSDDVGHVLLLPTLNSSARADRPWLQQWQRLPQQDTLEGYQLWAVEQRVTHRQSLLPVIIVLTGDANDKIKVDRYRWSEPACETHTHHNETWADLKALFKASNARITLINLLATKQTTERQARNKSGYLPLTALPSLDPSLSVVQLPGGDFGQAVPQLYANINLRRLGLGGRSALRLTSPTGAQQLNFRQTYRLPHNLPSSRPASTDEADRDCFAESVLVLVQLVQHALSLFGLGPVKRTQDGHSTISLPAGSSPVGSSTSNPLARHVLDTLNSGSLTSTSSLVQSQYQATLSQGDGLLCDVTLNALAAFKEEYAGPLLHVPIVDQAALSPQMLASLLSLVIGSKTKLAALGISSIPRDPFTRRNRFLRALENFQRTYRINPVSPTLSRAVLAALNHTYSRSRHSHDSVAGTTKAKVSRVIRTKFDVGLSTLGAAATSVGHSNQNSKIEDVVTTLQNNDNNNNSNTMNSKLGIVNMKGIIEEIETSNLDQFLILFQKVGTGQSISKLWGFKESRRDRKEDEQDNDGNHVRDSLNLRKRRQQFQHRSENNAHQQDLDTDFDGTEPGATTSEGEFTNSNGFGRGVLKGVKRGAGRAGRLLGDNLGFTDAHLASTSNASSRDLSRLTPSVTISSEKSSARQASIDNESGTNNSKSGSLANRLASALSADIGLPTSVRQRLSPSPVLRVPTSSRERNFKEIDQDITFNSRMSLPRRVISDAQGALPTMKTFGYVNEHVKTSFSADKTEFGLKRRHSFNIVEDAPEPSQILSRKRLVLDMNLRATYMKLRQRERELQDMVRALETIRDAYDQAISSIEPLVENKAQQLSILSTSASNLTTHTESYSIQNSNVSKLSIGTSRLSYAQSIVDEKLIDVTDFEKLLKTKVDQNGSIEKGILNLINQMKGGSGFLKFLNFQSWK